MTLGITLKASHKQSKP